MRATLHYHRSLFVPCHVGLSQSRSALHQWIAICENWQCFVHEKTANLALPGARLHMGVKSLFLSGRQICNDSAGSIKNHCQSLELSQNIQQKSLCGRFRLTGTKSHYAVFNSIITLACYAYRLTEEQPSAVQHRSSNSGNNRPRSNAMEMLMHNGSVPF